MTRERFFDALDAIDIDIVEDFVLTDNALEKRSEHKKPKYLKWTALAACLVLVVCFVPFIKNIFTPSHGSSPVTVRYSSFEELSVVLPYNNFYKALDSENANTVSIGMSYASDKDGNAITTQPLQLKIRQTYECENYTDTVDFYIIFGKTDVNESYIAGYEEQGLTKEINGVTVHYSMIDDGAKHAQGKFIYEGNLYVVDVLSGGSEYALDVYLEKVLGDWLPDDFYVKFVIDETYYCYVYNTDLKRVMINDSVRLFDVDRETLEKIYKKASECNMLEYEHSVRNKMNKSTESVYRVTLYAHGRQYVSTAYGFLAWDEEFYKTDSDFASFVDFMKEIMYSTPEFIRLDPNAPHF